MRTAACFPADDSFIFNASQAPPPKGLRGPVLGPSPTSQEPGRVGYVFFLFVFQFCFLKIAEHLPPTRCPDRGHGPSRATLGQWWGEEARRGGACGRGRNLLCPRWAPPPQEGRGWQRAPAVPTVAHLPTRAEVPARPAQVNQRQRARHSSQLVTKHKSHQPVTVLFCTTIKTNQYDVPQMVFYSQ